VKNFQFLFPKTVKAKNGQNNCFLNPAPSSGQTVIGMTFINYTFEKPWVWSIIYFLRLLFVAINITELFKIKAKVAEFVKLDWHAL